LILHLSKKPGSPSTVSIGRVERRDEQFYGRGANLYQRESSSLSDRLDFVVVRECIGLVVEGALAACTRAVVFEAVRLAMRASMWVKSSCSLVL